MHVGTLDTGEDFWLDLTEESHLLVAGASRTGKSRLLYNTLAQVLAMPSARVGGLDPSGLLLNRLPPSRFMALGPAARLHVGALESLVEELDARLEYMRDLGVDSLRAPEPHMPLLVIVLEEWPAVVAMCRELDGSAARRTSAASSSIANCLQRLVAEGLKAAIRVVLVTQRADADLLGGFTRSNILKRVVFRSEESAARMILGDPSERILRQVMTAPKQVGLYVDGFSAPRFFRSDSTSVDDLNAAARAAGGAGEA